MTPSTADHLLDLSEDEFNLVDDAVRGTTGISSISDALLDPSVIDRTHLTLVGMKKSVEGQLAAKKVDYQRDRARFKDDPKIVREIEDKYYAWRAGALRFKSGVEAFMLPVRSKMNRPLREDNFYLAYETLRQAITKHREIVTKALEESRDPGDADEILWSFLDR